MLTVPDHDVVGIRAPNPGPFTLSGTNTWVVGRDPAHVVDPGPDIPEHVDRLVEELGRRGGLGGIALTHDHDDHRGAVAALARRTGGPPVGAARGEVDRLLSDGARCGPLIVVATPGHAPDHLAFLFERVAFTGDAVLGEGSVFVSGQLVEYLHALRRLRALEPAVLCPGHGPVIADPRATLEGYLAHRQQRERRLLDALGRGVRGEAELLDDVWSDAPAGLRPAAALTLRAHLAKLAGEDRLPVGVEPPAG